MKAETVPANPRMVVEISLRNMPIVKLGKGNFGDLLRYGEEDWGLRLETEDWFELERIGIERYVLRGEVVDFVVVDVV